MSDSPKSKLRAVITDEGSNPRLVRDLYKFRKLIFVDYEKWDLPTSDGLERDQFDTKFTKHIAVFRDDVLVATFRAIRTDHKYLAVEIFPELAKTKSFPRSKNSWEISRFGVIPFEHPKHRFEVARFNYAVMFRFALSHNATSLVAVADTQYERFLRSIGIATRRYGPPQIISKSAESRSFELLAGEIPMHDQSGPKFEALLKLSQTLEVHDETAIFRHEAISA